METYFNQKLRFINDFQFKVSRICTGANQGPVRLANGAIAKTLSSKKDYLTSASGPMTSPRGSSAPTKSSKYTLLRADSNDPAEEKGYKCAKCTQVKIKPSSTKN